MNNLLSSTSSLQYQLPISFQILFGVALILGTVLIPETPRYYLENQQFEDARIALAWFRSENVEGDDVIREFEDMMVVKERLEVRREFSKETFWKEIRKNGVGRRLYIGITLMALQNLVGLNAINYCKLLLSPPLVPFFPPYFSLFLSLPSSLLMRI